MAKKKPQQNFEYAVDELTQAGVNFHGLYAEPEEESAPAAPAKAPERSTFYAVNDFMIDAGNSAAGLVKAGVDLVSPDGSVSQAIDGFIKDGQDKQSDKKKFLRNQLSTNLQAAGENDGTTSGQLGAEADKAGVYLKHAFFSDPLGTLGEIVGNVGPFALLGKGMHAAKLSEGIRTAVASGAGAGLSAGEVRGNIWERINGTKDAELQTASPVYAALRESGMSEADAKSELGANFMRNLPETGVAALLGALGGKYGVEGMTAGVAPKLGRVGSAVVGGINEGLQGTTEQVASNYGVQRVNPNQSLIEDIGTNTVAEALPGVATGVVTGSHGGNSHVEPPSKSAGPLSRAAEAAAPVALAPSADPITQRVSEVEAEVRSGKLLDALRASNPEAASGLVDALAAAKNETLPPSAREQAVAEIDGIMRELQMRPAQAAGQAWQDLGMSTPADDLAAQRAQSEGINTAGQQWQDLGMTAPGDDLSQQKAEHQAGVAAEAGNAWQALAPGIKEGGDSSGIPDSQRYPDRQPAAAPAPEPAPAEAPAPTVARRTVAAPKVAVPAGEGPAVKRQRIAQLQALVADGFSTIERNDSGQVMLVNPKRGEQVELENALEAQRARKIMADYVAAQAATAATSPDNDLKEPTQAQAEAGNYKKAAMRVAGADLMIENAAGSTRSGVGQDGKAWSTPMVHHYGYVKRSEGADGDGVDVFVGPRPDSNQVFVVDQVDPKTGKFDEHKVMLGFTSEADARAGYLANYEPGWQGIGAVTPMTAEQFHAWMKGDDLALPVNKDVPANELADEPGDAKLVAALRSQDPSIRLAGNTPEANALRALLRSMESIFGVHGVPVESDGAFDGFAHKGVVYVNVRTPMMHVMQTIGHELAHTKEGVVPQLRDRIWSLIDDAGKKVYFEKYLFRANSLANPGKTAVAYKSATPEQIETLKSEMLADFFGGRFHDKGWLQALAKQKPHLFGEFIRDWLQMLKRITVALRSFLGMMEPGSVKQIDQYIRDVALAHQLALEVASEWAAKNKKMAEQSKVAEHLQPLQASEKLSSPKLMLWAKDFLAGMRVPGAMQVSAAPSVPLRMAGLQGDSKIMVSSFMLSHIQKHGVDPEMIGQLPYLLARPRAVVVTYERDGQVSHAPQDGYEKRYNVLVDQRDSEGRPYLVAIKYGVHGAGIADVRTMFGRNSSLNYILRAAREGGFVYVDKKEVDRLKAITGAGTIPDGSPEGASKPKSPEQPLQDGLQADGQRAIVYADDAAAKFLSGGPWQESGVSLNVTPAVLLRNDRAHFSERITSINELGAFNLDAGLSADEDLDMAAFLEEVEREAAAEAEAQAVASVPAPVAAPRKDVLSGFGDNVSDAEIEANGLMAEDAYDDLPWKKQAGTDDVYRVLYQNPAKPLKINSVELERHHKDTWRVNLPGAWVGPAMFEEDGYATRKTAERFAQRHVASVDLFARGFDLRDGVPADKLPKALIAWKRLNQLDRVEKGVRRYGRAKEGAGIKDIAESLGADKAYDLELRSEQMDPFNTNIFMEFVNKQTGQVQSASMMVARVGDKKLATIEALGLQRGGLGAAVYQIAAEYAASRDITIKPDSSISGVNAYRRTEQMLSAALRTGKSNVMVPHETQRIYGFDQGADTQDEHDANIQRLLLAGLRNARELAPELDRLEYDVTTGAFFFKNGQSAENLVITILGRNDARSFGLGRSTLARAVVTRMALDGKFDASEVESLQEPLLYSERIGADLEYQAVEQQYRGTDEWMKAPNGKPTNLNERQWVQVRTPSFKAWFGDWETAARNDKIWYDDVSKVVDTNGEPLVVYHGSEKAGFMEFKEPSGKGRGDLGLFATNDYPMARSYVRKGRAQDVEAPDERDELDRIGVIIHAASLDDGPVSYSYETPQGEEKIIFDSREAAITDALEKYGDAPDATYGGVYELFLNIRDPGEEDFRGATWSGEFHDGDAFEVYDADGIIVYDDQGNDVMSREQAERLAELNGGTFEPASPTGRTTDDVVHEARRSNDGAIIYNVIDDGGGPGYGGDPQTVFVAFKPNQLKSANFNDGSFSEKSDDIRYSERVEAMQPERKPKQKAPRMRETISADEARGHLVSYQVQIEDSGETAELTVDAGDAMQDLDKRLAGMRELLACLGK